MEINFRTAAVTISQGIVTAIFTDGKRNEMNTHWLEGLPGYKDIAREMGYGDMWRQYAMEHELTHHFVADLLAMRWSWAVHDDVHYDVMPEWIAWEEHIVNRLQRYMRTGQRDEHGVLDALFDERLSNVAADLRMICEKIS